MAKKSLYVYRPLLNADEVIAWAKGAGFRVCLPPANMHVTVLYSKGEVEWSEDSPLKGHITVNGGERALERFGGGACVLSFKSNTLKGRNATFMDMGATSDFSSYKSHVTLSYKGDGLLLKKMGVYRGILRFGGEKWEAITAEGFDPDSVTEKSHA